MLVQQDHFVEAARLRIFEPSQIEAPRQHLGTSEHASGMARLRLHRKANAAPPVMHIGRESDQVEVAMDAGSVKQAAAIAKYGDSQSTIPGAVGRYQPKQIASQAFGVGGKRHSQQRRVALHPRPMPLPGEQYTFKNANGAEYAPPSHQSYLTRRQQFFAGLENAPIVQEI